MKAAVIEVVRETPSVVLLRLKPSSPLSFKPGQFVSVLVEVDGRKVMKPYSISSSPHMHGYIELCIKVVRGGRISNYLANLEPGAELGISGSHGHFTLQDEINNDLVFVATGTGISALKPMIDAAFNRGVQHDVWLLFGVRTESDIIYRKDFEGLARANSRFHFVPVLSRSGSPDFEQGHVQDAFRRIVSPKNQDVYICGLYVMVDEMKQLCRDLGFSEGKVHYEKYV